MREFALLAVFVAVVCSVEGGLQTAARHEKRNSTDSSDTSVQSGQQGCPRISDLNVMYDSTRFLSMHMWQGPGHDLALLGCNGEHHWQPQDFMTTAAPGRAFFIGSIVVLPGCTFTGFRDVNYRGPTYVLEGPVVQSHINFNAGFNHDHGDVGWFGSFVATCEQQLPNCVASDSWVTVGSLDNSQSAFPAEYTYQHTVGTEFSKSTQHSVDISSQVSTEVKSKFFGFFKGKLGVSVKTGYDWTRVSSEATSEVVTTEVKIMIPPHERVQLDRATGTCGGSVVHTELMRTVSSKPSSFKASPRVEYWTGDNIML